MSSLRRPLLWVVLTILSLALVLSSLATLTLPAATAADATTQTADPDPLPAPLTLDTGHVSTLSGSRDAVSSRAGSATTAVFKSPTAVAIDSDFVFVATADKLLMKVEKSTGNATVLAGILNSYGDCASLSVASGSSLRLTDPIRSMVVVGSQVYAVAGSCGVVKIDTTTGATSRVTALPAAVAVTRNGNDLLSVNTTGQVSRMSLTTSSVMTLGASGVTSDSFEPASLASSGDKLWIGKGKAVTTFDLAASTSSTLVASDGINANALTFAGGKLHLGGSYATSRVRHLLRTVDVTTGTLGTVAGSYPGHRDGTGPHAAFTSIGPLATDGDSLYLTDAPSNGGSATLRRVSPGIPLAQAPSPSGLVMDNGDVTTVLGQGPVTSSTTGSRAEATLSAPGGITVLDGYAYTATKEPYFLKTDLLTGETTKLAGKVLDTYTSCTDHAGPSGDSVAFQPYEPPRSLSNDGNFVYATSSNCGILRLDPATGATSLIDPVPAWRAVTRGPDGMFYTVNASGEVHRMDSSSGAVTKLGSSAPLPFYARPSIAADDQWVWVATAGQVHRFDLSTGTGSLFLADSSIGGQALASMDGHLFVSGGNNDGGNHQLLRISKSDASVRLIAGGPLDHGDGRGGRAGIKDITGIATTAHSLYLTENSGYIRQVTPAGAEQSALTPEATRTLDLTSGDVTTLPSVGGASGLVMLGGYAYVSAGDYTVRKIDLATGQGTILAGAPGERGRPCETQYSSGALSRFYDPLKALVTDGTYIYGVNLQCGIYRLDPHSGATTLVADETSFQSLTVGGDRALYATKSEVLYRYDITSGSFAAVVDFNPLVANQGAEMQGSLTSDQDSLWYTRRGTGMTAGTVFRVDLATGTVTRFLDDPDLVSSSLESAGNYLYGIRKQSSTATGVTLVRIDKRTKAVTSAVGSTEGLRDGRGGSAQIRVPSDTSMDGSSMVLLDATAGKLRRVSWAPVTTPAAVLAPENNNQMLPGETVGGMNPSLPTTSSREHGDPVSTFTGDFATEATDAEVGGRGFPLSFSRTYSAQRASEKGTLGHGWNHSYDMRVTVGSGSTAGLVTVRQEDGSLAYFVANANGTYSAPARVQATLAKNADGSWTFVRRAQATFTFNADGTLRSLKDLNNYVITLAYTSGRLVSVTEPSGRQLTFTYDTTGRVTKMVAPGSRATTYTYSSAGDLTRVTAPDTTAVNYVYDTAHRMTKLLDRAGAALTNSYDAASRATQQVDPLGRTTTYAYWNVTAPGSHQALVTAPDGTVTREVYLNGRIMEESHAWGTPVVATHRFEYDEKTGNLTAVVDPLGRVARTTWDARGNVLTSTDSSGRVTRWTYNARNFVTSTATPDGSRVTLTYDANSNPTASTRTVGSRTQTTTYKYDASKPGDLLEVIDPSGSSTKFAYNTNGYPVSVTDALGRVRSSSVDLVGQVLSTTSPLGNVSGVTAATKEAHTSYAAYDSAGNVTSTTDELDRTTSFTYDATGRVLTTKDPLGRVTTSSYDAAGQLLSTKRPDGLFLRQAYDQLGRVVSSTDASGRTVSQSYDALGRVSTLTDQLGRVSSATYDRLGNVESTTDSAGLRTSYSYNADNQVIGIDHPNGTPDVTFGYDALGRRTSMTDGTGTTRYAFTPTGSVSAITDGSGATTGYTYDALDRVSAMTYPSGRVVNYSYDATSALTTLTSGSSAYRYTYDGDGRPSTLTYPNSLVETTSYDVANQVTSIVTKRGSTTVGSFNYQFDAAGQTTLMGSSGTPAKTLTNVFDSLGRVTSSTSEAGTTGATAESFGLSATGDVTGIDGFTQTFDATGALKERVRGGVSTTYAYNATGGRTTRAGPDPASYSWDAAGRMTTLTSASTRADYTYDGTGLRTEKAVTTGSSTSSSTFTWDRLAGLPLLLSDGTHEYLYGLGGQPLAQFKGTGVEYLHADTLGSTRLISDANGQVTGTAAYSTYGKPTTTGTASSALGFSGQYTDAESGLVYLRARYYEPETAQFLSRDPIWNVTGEGYSYAGGNPLQLSDPSGLFWGEATLAAAGRATGNFTFGALDSVTMGASTWAVNALGGGGIFDRCSKAFKAGGVTATGVEIGLAVVAAVPTGGASLAVVGAKQVAKSGVKSTLRSHGDDLAKMGDDLASAVTSCTVKSAKHSFTGSTLVLMADGTRKRIDEIDLGDRVLATNPLTGKSTPREVTALHVNVDKELTDLVVRDDGRLERIGTTPNHPFWDATDKEWVGAGELTAGDALRGADGSRLRVVAGTSRVGTSTMYDLTVAEVHTYHVGEADVLVHNTDSGDEVVCPISLSAYPQAAGHIKAAQQAGQPVGGKIDRSGASSRRRSALRGHDSVPGKDRDEYPPALLDTGGAGSSIRAIDPSDNRGAGSTMGRFLRGYPDGTYIRLEVVD